MTKSWPVGERRRGVLPVLPCGHAPPFRPRHRLGSRQPTRDRSGRAAGAWTEKDGEFPALFKPLLFGSLSPQLNEAPEECAARAEAGDFRPRRTAGRAGARPAEAWPWSHPEPSAPSLPSALVLVTQELRMMTSDINGARAVAQASTPGSRQGPHGLGDSPERGPCARHPSSKSALACSKTGARQAWGLGFLTTWNSRAHHRGPHTARMRAAGEEPPGDPGRTLWIPTPDVCGEGCGTPRVPERTKLYPEGRAGHREVVLRGDMTPGTPSTAGQGRCAGSADVSTGGDSQGCHLTSGEPATQAPKRRRRKILNCPEKASTALDLRHSPGSESIFSTIRQSEGSRGKLYLALTESGSCAPGLMAGHLCTAPAECSGEDDRSVTNVTCALAQEFTDETETKKDCDLRPGPEQVGQGASPLNPGSARSP